MHLTVVLSALALSALPLAAQQASFVYRLGKDTVAIEQFTRAGSRWTGEMLQRSGAAVTLVRYEMTLAARPSGTVDSWLQADERRCRTSRRKHG
jgi:hypothetical protein